MEILTALVILAATLAILLVFLPMAMVYFTKSENDEGSASYITSKYIEKIGWRYAKWQILSLFTGWLPLVAIASKGGSIGATEFAFLASLSAAFLFWFYINFKGLFNIRVPWYDGTAFNSTVLVGILLIQSAGSFNILWPLSVGGLFTVWWGGRLFMYKAIRECGA